MIKLMQLNKANKYIEACAWLNIWSIPENVSYILVCLNGVFNRCLLGLVGW